MSEPRIFTAKGKGEDYDVLMAENGAPPEKLAKFVHARVASNYTQLFDALGEYGEKLTGMRGMQVTDPEELARIGYDLFDWMGKMAGGS